jgi:hypothetical protein
LLFSNRKEFHADIVSSLVLLGRQRLLVADRVFRQNIALSQVNQRVPASQGQRIALQIQGVFFLFHEYCCGKDLGLL